jgi:hypothetical protein
VVWYGDSPILSPISRSINADGTPALSNAELGERLVGISIDADGGNPKTGRRFYYLALSHGDICPDMGAFDAAKRSRDAAYKRICDVLVKLRMVGDLRWEDVLDLTRELVQWRVHGSPREARARMRETYDKDCWLGQPYYPILIVEKDTRSRSASRWPLIGRCRSLRVAATPA